MADPWEKVAADLVVLDRELRPEPTPAPTVTPTRTPPPISTTSERLRSLGARSRSRPPSDGQTPRRSILERFARDTGLVREIAEKVLPAVARKVDQAELLLAPVAEVAGPRILQALSFHPQTSAGAASIKKAGAGKVNPKSEDLAFKYVTRKGTLSGPELAGVLRSNFQERSMADQIILSVLADPLNVVPGEAITVPARLAGRAAVRTGRAVGRIGGELASGAGRRVADTAIDRGFVKVARAGFDEGLPPKGPGEGLPPRGLDEIPARVPTTPARAGEGPVRLTGTYDAFKR
ncbi:hypothetical protein CMI37_21015, partial [Candidatus Pacearchaeota archaeon]|nr:hypothetical protein [Candidatus Pacearchaeota archaeon]